MLNRSRIPILRPGIALFLLLFGWYVVTTSGHTYTNDEETVLAVGERIVEHGTFTLPLDFLMTHRTGVDGQRYSRYGPGQSIAAVPFIAAGNFVASVAPHYASGFIMRLFVSLLPALVTAATGLVLYAWVRHVGYGPRVGLLVGLLYGTSLAWPYSRTFFTEPLTTCFLVVCAYGIRRDERRWWVIAGAAAGCALTVKLQALLLLPAIAGYAVLVCWRGGATPWRSMLHALAGRVAMGLAGLALPLALLLLYNIQIFGGPFETGYGGVDPTGLLDSDWKQGLYGLLLSTGKGVFFFSPTILLGLIGIGLHWRQQWRESLLALAVFVINVGFYCRLSYWHGDGSWGPRYMVFVLPFVYLPIAGLLAAIAERRMRVVRALIGVLAGITFLIQLLPVLVNFNTYLWLSNETHDPHQRYFRPLVSPLVGHMRIWAERASEWWLRVAPPDGVAILYDGFSYSEGDRSKGDILPRWSYADADIRIYPLDGNSPIEGELVVGDHRPWPLPRAKFMLLLNGQPLEGVQRSDMTGESITWKLQFMLMPQEVERGATITLQSDTWNPDDMTDENPRDEHLGVRVEHIALQQHGQSLAVREALPIPTVKPGRRDLWLWYYDSPRHHLFDAWLWFVFVAALPVGTVALLLVLVALPALGMVVVGMHGVARAIAGF